MSTTKLPFQESFAPAAPLSLQCYDSLPECQVQDSHNQRGKDLGLDKHLRRNSSAKLDKGVI